MLFTLSREQRISFEGVVTDINGTQWNVSGIPVFIQPDTTIIAGNEQLASIAPGMRVEVEGETTQQGKVLAVEIHLCEYEFIGSVEKIEVHDWLINGVKINILPHTQVDAEIQVGDEVTVLIRSTDEGLYALAIREDKRSIKSPLEYHEMDGTPTPNPVSSDENIDTYEFSRIINSIGVSHWIIDGVVYQIYGNSHIEENIGIGEPVSIIYRIEKDGSFVAIEIKLSDENDYQEEQETPETTESPED